MKTLKLPDKLFALAYQTIVNAMGEVKRTDPQQRVDDLQEIELIMSKEYEKTNK